MLDLIILLFFVVLFIIGVLKFQIELVKLRFWGIAHDKDIHSSFPNQQFDVIWWYVIRNKHKKNREFAKRVNEARFWLLFQIVLLLVVYLIFLFTR